MAVYYLPGDIFPGQTTLPGDIIMHEYAAKIGSFKGKSILQKNAISLVVSGQKTMHFAEKTVYVNELEIHFLSAGNCLASMDLSQQDVFRSILVFFDDSTLTDFYVKYAALVSNHKIKNPIEKQAYLSIKKDAFIYNYIDSVLVMLKSNSTISSQMKQLKFEELMLYLLEKYPLEILSFQKTIDNFDDIAIREIIEANITNNLTLEELAFLCNTSLSTFKRRFAKIYNSAPNKWLLQRRMNIAAHLLQQHRQKPGEIFHQLGYENHSSFSQSFKQVFGVTPKEYQSQNLTV